MRRWRAKQTTRQCGKEFKRVDKLDSSAVFYFKASSSLVHPNHLSPSSSQLTSRPLPALYPTMSEIRRKLVIVGDGACGKVR